MDDDFSNHVLDASARADVREAVGKVYAELQAEVEIRHPVCIASGRCCRFEEFGHRLFVTTMELAAFVHGLRDTAPARPGGAAGAPWDGTGCPFQVGKLCGVHSIRPFGCRMFFCDATSTGWQNQAYEQFHARLRRLHDDLGVPYRYVEWRQALNMLGLAVRA